MFIVLQINKLTSGAISNLRKLRLYGEVKKKNAKQQQISLY
jgi:hypothetical protein